MRGNAGHHKAPKLEPGHYAPSASRPQPLSRELCLRQIHFAQHSPSRLESLDEDCIKLLLQLQDLVKSNPATTLDLAKFSSAGPNHADFETTLFIDIGTIRTALDSPGFKLVYPIGGGRAFLKHVAKDCPKCRATLRSKELAAVCSMLR
jgi:hypothetical protein